MTEEETQGKIQQLQLLEQSVTNLTNQKQNFQVQLAELESALTEIKDKEEAYKIVGNIMVKKSKAELEKDLNAKREIVETRIKSLEKQESALNEKKDALQKEVVASLKEKK